MFDHLWSSQKMRFLYFNLFDTIIAVSELVGHGRLLRLNHTYVFSCNDLMDMCMAFANEIASHNMTENYGVVNQILL